MAKKGNTGASPPTNTASEEAVIGTIMCNAAAMQQASKILAPDDFWSSETSVVFESCMSLYDKGQSVDKESVASELKGCKKLTEIGGEEYLDKLIGESDAVLFSSYVSIVKNLSVLRKAIYLGSKIVKDAMSLNADAVVLLQDIGTDLKGLNARVKGIGPRIVDLTILTSNPRNYRIKFSDGKEVKVGLDIIMNPKAVKLAIINKLDFVPALPADWEKFMKNLMTDAKKSAVPYNADIDIEILDVIRDLFNIRGEGKEASDFKSGSYAMDTIDGKEYYLFQKSAVTTHIKQQLDRKILTGDLWQLVDGWGGINKKDGKPISKRVGNESRTQLWGLPVKVIDEGITVKETEIEFTEDGEIDVSFL